MKRIACLEIVLKMRWTTSAMESPVSGIFLSSSKGRLSAILASVRYWFLASLEFTYAVTICFDSS